MPRPVWTGSIAFGLVSVPVKLFSAVREKTVRFNQLEKGTGARIRYRRVSEQSGEEVERDDIVRGYELDDGSYVEVADDELEAVSPGASKTIDLEDFVELAEIDPVYFDGTYFLAPADEGAARAYKLLHEAMRRSGKAALGRLVLRSKQRLVALRAREGILVLETMHFHDEVADPGDVELPQAAEPSERDLAAAQQLVEAWTAQWDPAAYADTYREQVMALIERKAQGEDVVSPVEPERPGKVIDLAAALRESASQRRGPSTRAPDSDEPRQHAAEAATSPSGEAAAPDGAGLEELSRQQLYELAQRAGIRGRSEMSKGELLAALREDGASSRTA